MQPSANVILQTKLRRPPLAAGLLARPRLLARLDRAADCTLTLVTAPAGWGKTSLVCQWLEGRALPAAWLQLDASDGDPALFFTYVVYALRQLEPQFGAETEILLRSATLPPAVLANTLSNELDQMQRAAPCLLVLDDYHLVQNPEIDRALARLVQRPPRDLHLIVLSRQAPTWPLGRLRLQDRLLEVGIADLRFTREEIATYLDRSTGLALPSDMLARLQKQTEGWAAGLQLTALALRRQHDAQALLGEEGGLSGFVGSDNRYLLEYMVDEVLADLPADLLQFMYVTSICTHFNVKLCEVLTGGDGDTVRGHLRSLQEADLFLIPLDAGWKDGGEPTQGERHRWYRCHHLMQQTLAQRLQDSAGPEAVAELHRRAAIWLGEQGYTDEALEHLTKIADWDTAAYLVARQLDTLLNREDRRTVERRLASFPTDEIERRPTLLLMQAWSCFFNLDIAGLAYNMAALNAIAAAPPHKGESGAALFPTRDWLPEFEGHHILLQGVVGYFHGQLEATIAAARQALTLVPRSSAFVYGNTYFYLATAMQMVGQDDEAEALVLEAYRREQPKPTQISARLLFTAATVRLFSGRLNAAYEFAELLLRESRSAHLGLLEGWAHDMLGRIDYERNDLDGAEVHFAALRERCFAVHRGCAYDGFTGSLLVAAVRGRSAATAQIGEEWRSFEQSLWGLPGPLHYSARARAALLLGDSAAGRWAASFNVPLGPPPMFWLETSHITKVRCLLASNVGRDLEEADRLLAACLAQAERQHNQPAYLTLLALRSLALERKGQRKAALDTLRQALPLGAAEGLVRTFADLGPSMWNLLGAVTDPELADYVAELRSAFTPVAPRLFTQLQDSPAAALTQRELEILALLATPLSLQEIGDKLFISYSTVRQHTAHIYEKLGVGKRRHAVLTAAELGLLGKSSPTRHSD